MEIGRIRKELTELLDNITEHSNKYSDERTIPSLEVGAILTKINRAQEGMAVLRHLLEEQEKEAKQKRQKEVQARAEALIQSPETNTPDLIVAESPVVSSSSEKAEEVVEPVFQHAPTIEKQDLEPKNVEQLVNSKLTDLLTLNDRYLYANELFNKDMSAFNDLVKAIDDCGSFDEAQKLYVSLDWEIDNEHVLSFTNLVERRFL